MSRADAAPPHALEDLSAFAVREIINDGRDAAGKLVILGQFANCSSDALVKLQRAPLPHDERGVREMLERIRLRSRAPYSGAEYGYYVGELAPSTSASSGGEDVECDVLYPGCLLDADETSRAKLLKKHITRSSTQKLVCVRETPELYAKAHEKYIASIPREATAWVRKILSLEKERERLLHCDDDFLLNVDSKWTTHPDCDGADRATWRAHSSVTDLYCLGLCVREDFKSLRDARAEHLPLLRAMLRKGRAVIEDIYGVNAEEMRVFVHYPPQFYHFHVHYQALSAKEQGCACERAHSLEDIIDNLERDGDHYARANLSLKMGERDTLYAFYNAAAARA